MAQKVENMNWPNMVEAPVCECRLRETETIGTAVARVIGANQLGIYPVVPVGGTNTRQELKWGQAFSKWIRREGLVRVCTGDPRAITSVDADPPI
jgi:hypothetical protein